MKRYSPRGIRSFLSLAFAALIVLGLSACGGGGGNFADGGIVGTGAQGYATQGVITALGSHSIVVNGRSVATTGVPITVNAQPSTDAALMIGMVVTVIETAQPGAGMTVTSIEYHSEVQGVVTGVDPSVQTFTVLGQRVQTNALTLYNGGSFDTLLNQVVEVSGFRSTPGDLLATLVIVKPLAPKTMLTVTGVIGALDTAAHTFTIGLQLFDYTAIAATSVPPGFAVAATVRVGGTQTSPTATALVDTIVVVPPAPPNVTTAEFEGLVTEFVNLGSFKINGQATDARAASVQNGTADMIANGALINVEGTLSNGVLVATQVEIEHVTVIQLDGVAQAVDVGSATVTVGGQIVRITGNTQFIDSSSAALSNFSLAAVAVGDRLSLLAYQGANGLTATRLERLNPSAPPPGQPPTTIQGTITSFVSIANFFVGGQQVNAGAASFAGGTAANLANGVSVQAAGTIANGVLNATTVQFLPGSSPPSVTVTGTISNFVSVSNFVVAGQKVDASTATFSNGHASDLANGQGVTVTGVVQNGTLVAQTVTFAQPPQQTNLEVEGSISNFVSVSSFVVQGQKVNASQATFYDGSASSLANGVSVDVKGVLQNGVLVATSVDVQSGSQQQEISVRGLITNYVSISNFTVAGRVVDASNAKFDGGNASSLANGVSVQVQGFLNGQVLMATEIEIDD